MGKFSKLKKYNLKSLSIDEKIKFLDKELERTGLNEQPANSTSGVYSGSVNNPNKQYIEFTAKSFNGYAFGFSGDSNLGHKNVGGATIRPSDGAALSPPHPVTGERRTTQTKAGIDPLFKIAIPGERPTPDSRKTGPILWYYDPNASSGQGSWRSLEYNSAAEHGNQPFPFGGDNAGFGYWGTGAFGFPLLRSDGDAFASLFAALNDSDGNQFNPDTMSNPETVVLTKDKIDDPNFLPIDIAKRFIAGSLDLAKEGLDYLLNALRFYGGLPTAASNMIYHTNVQDPSHPDHRKHDPTSDNYIGPKEVIFNPIEAAQTDNDIESIINGLNGGKGPKNPNELNIEEIKELSDGMNAKYKENPTWYNTFHSLPTHNGADGKPITKVTKNEFGGWDVESNYFFTDDEDASDPFSNIFGNTPLWTPRKATIAAAKKNKNHPDANKFIIKKTGEVIGGQFNTQQVYRGRRPRTFSGGVKESLDESVKLGHFDPEALTVDIEDIRKGVMPEFPKKPPAEMIDGYSVKSKLAPRVIKGEPTIKTTKKDLAALHILKDSEIKELLQQIDLINAHLQNNPADLIYAQQRYPKNDIRLAQLNWKMDQMLEAGEEYLDTQFPENQRLVDRIKKATKKTMELTNPEAYKNLNKPDMELMSLDDHMKQKRIVSRHFKKKRQSKSMFRVDMNKVKENNRKVAEQKVAEWQEKRRIELLNSNEFEDQKYDWRKEIGEDFVNTTQGMKVGQTFTHVPSGQSVTTSGILGGIETLQTSVEFFGDAIPGPDASQYGLQGFAKPIDIMRRGKKKSEDLNKELDSSEQYTKEIKADEFMKARVKTGELSLEQKKEFVEIYKNDMEEWNKKSEARARENESGRKSNISKVKSFVKKFGANLDKIKGVQTFIKIVEEGKKLIVINQDNIFRDLSDKFNVRVFEAEEGKVITRQTGNFGRVDSSIFDNPFTNRKSSGQATIMYDGVGRQIESKNFVHKELPSIPMPTPPKFMQKNMNKGWQPSATSSFDQEFINKMKIFAGKNFVSSLAGSNFPAQLAVQLAQGDLTPVTKSPGPAITNIIKSNIEFVMSTGKTKDLPDFDSKGNKLDPDLKKNHSFFNPITGNGAVRYNAYGDYGVASAPVSASLGSYSIERTDKGIRISDKFDISSGFTAPGGAAYFSPLTQLVGGRDMQSTGETLTAIAARRAAELGYDMVDTDTGEPLQPIYSGEEEFNSRNYPNSGAPTIATPKGFDIKIDFTIPWDSFSPETATLLKIGSKEKVDPLSNNKSKQVVSKEPSKAVQKIKSMSKARRQSLSLDEPIVKRKKKKS